MRVIAGKLKGRKLIGPKTHGFRPTLERVKESIFNVIGDDIIGSSVLDLFCGTGALGIEAISRGAASATFVDSSRPVLKIARTNAANLGIEDKTEFIAADVFDYFKKARHHHFTIVLADPPYDKMHGTALCRNIVEYKTLKMGGIFVLERYKKEKPESADFRLIKKLTFGQTEVDFFIRKD